MSSPWARRWRRHQGQTRQDRNGAGYTHSPGAEPDPGGDGTDRPDVPDVGAGSRSRPTASATGSRNSADAPACPTARPMASASRPPPGSPMPAVPATRSRRLPATDRWRRWPTIRGPRTSSGWRGRHWRCNWGRKGNGVYPTLPTRLDNRGKSRDETTKKCCGANPCRTGTSR